MSSGPSLSERAMRDKRHLKTRNVLKLKKKGKLINSREKELSPSLPNVHDRVLALPAMTENWTIIYNDTISWPKPSAMIKKICPFPLLLCHRHRFGPILTQHYAIYTVKPYHVWTQFFKSFTTISV